MSGRRRFPWAAAAFVVLAVAVVIGVRVNYVRVDAEAEARAEADRRAEVQADYRACLDRLAGRQVLRELVIEATTGAGPVRFDLVPGFDQLDPATQAYFLALSEALNDPSRDEDPDSFRQRALARLDLPECVNPKTGRTAYIGPDGKVAP